MALRDVFKNIGNELSEEIRQFKSIVGRVRRTADSDALGANFRKFGSSFNIYEYDEYVKKAEAFYQDGISSEDSQFTVIELPGDRVAIDYDCKLRGIFTRKGKPLAFFRHDYRVAGYESRAAELNDFKLGKHVLFS